MLQSLNLKGGFFVKQPLLDDTEFEWHWCTGRPFRFVLAGIQAYIHSHDIALDHMVFLLHALPLCFSAALYSAHAYLHHCTLTTTACNRLPEGRYDPI